MFVIAESETTVVRLDERFAAAQARSLEEMLELFRPVRQVVIDFAKVREIDAAAVARLAEALRASPESQVTFRGLSRHVRRVLRYLGVDAGMHREGAAPSAIAAG